MIDIILEKIGDNYENLRKEGVIKKRKRCKKNIKRGVIRIYLRDFLVLLK